jgi:signal transduction histidine kinase
MEVSENFLGLLGQSGAGKPSTLEQWLALVDATDRPGLADKFRKARADAPGAPLVMEARMRQPDGGCRWFYMHADWHRDDGGTFLLSGVNVDIQNLKTAEEELRRAIEKLKEADARKDEFLAMLAHELRNPLAPIRSAAELLRVAKLDETRVQKTSEIIARQVAHMTSLVDDLLDVSRVTRGLVKLHRTPLDIRQIVTDAVEQVNPLVRARRHKLALHLSPEPAMVQGDKKRLVQVIANLLNNAAKYTADGGNIVLNTQVEHGRVLLRVSDDGIGLERGLVDRVFDLFAQAERTPDRSSGGLGLGLALVKSLVELHGGTVTCASEGLGRGSMFTVCLPLMAAGEKSHPPQEADSALPSPGTLRVMVVDDNADAAQMLAMFLEASGHRVTVEHEARKALERARMESPEVCLLDIGLPEMDGKELARRIRAQPETANAVLIAVTGYGQEQDRQAALAAGFQHHLVKPVDPAKLVALLAHMQA